MLQTQKTGKFLIDYVLSIFLTCFFLLRLLCLSSPIHLWVSRKIYSWYSIIIALSKNSAVSEQMLLPELTAAADEPAVAHIPPSPST
jgi:hypothetical protein